MAGWVITDTDEDAGTPKRRSRADSEKNREIGLRKRRIAELREAMSAEELAEEEARLALEISAMIAAGRVTVCQPAGAFTRL
ncbi:hypothetical protein OE699_12815 [Sedimentimonas flavescens]|uniref:Uncharacterized protein n=2 Tax=Sedimentimonas flavescens TaxID=2851012 RepID=A0ABT3A1W8_9RHOB|nr:hypothetical protein [Sedimentimonas flavescens]